MDRDVFRCSSEKRFARGKIAIIFILVACVLMATTINLIYQVRIVFLDRNNVYQHPIVLSRSVANFKALVSHLNQSMRLVVTADNTKNREQLVTSLTDDIAIIEMAYMMLAEKGLSIKAELRSIYALFNQWKLVKKDIFLLLLEDEIDAAKGLIAKEAVQRLAGLKQSISSLEQSITAKVGAYEHRNLHLSKNIQVSGAVLFFLALLFVIYLSYELWQAKIIYLKESNRTLVVIDEHILIALLDKQGSIEGVSSALCQFLDCVKSELIERPRKFFLSSDKKGLLLETHIWNVISQGKEWRGDILFTSGSGKTVWAASSISPNFDNNYQLVGFTQNLYDLTAEKQVNIDKLTGLLNGRSYDDVFSSQINAAIRYGYPFSLSIIGIDHFKRFNDSYGQMGGEVAVKKLSTLLTQHMLRPSDFVFRIGEQKCAIIMSGLNEIKTQVFLESIRKALEALQIPNKNSSVSPYLTVSIGSCVMLEGVASEHQINQCAELAHHQAQQKGNKLVVTLLHSTEPKRV